MSHANHYRQGQEVAEVYHLADYKGAQIRAEENSAWPPSTRILHRIAGALEYLDTLNTLERIMSNPNFSPEFKEAAAFLVIASVMGWNIPDDLVYENFEDALAILEAYDTQLRELADDFPDFITYDSGVASLPWNPNGLPLSSFPPPADHIPLNGAPTPSPNDVGDMPRELPSIIPSISGPFNNSIPMGSPLIVDLDNDGVEATAFNPAMTTSFFDIDNDGFREQTAWLGADDGLVVRDLNSNGEIDSASELFGSATSDGFALLSILDINGDHVIDASDADFSDLMIWKDANGDAYVQNGELQSLAYWNIQSISLAGVSASTSIINGNPVSHISTVTLDSGATRAIADVWFVHDNINSFYDLNYEFDSRTLDLPNLRGFGKLPDLDIAMSLDEDLLEMVQELTQDWTLESFATGDALTDVEDILLKWAGVEGVDPYSRKEAYLDAYVDIDSRHLAFLEKFLGQDYFNTGNLTGIPGPMAYAELQNAWEFALGQMNAHLIVQMSASLLFTDAVSYNVWTGDFEGTIALSQTAIQDLVDYATAPGVDPETYWRNIAHFVAYTVGTDNLTSTEESWFDAAIFESDPSLTWAIVNSDAYLTGDYVYGTTGNDLIEGTTNNDTLYGNEGDDTIYAYAGHDMLYGGSDDDVIWAGAGADQVWADMGDDVVYGEDGADVIYGGSDNDELYGGNGNDYLYGESENDILGGGTGGNNLDGGSGNDTYLYQGGVDVIWEYGGTDIIQLPDGVAPGDITFTRIHNQYGGNLLIAIAGAGTVEINNQFYWNSLTHVETLDFYDPLDGTIDLTALTDLATHGTGGDDHILGVTSPNHLNDTIYGYGGADYLEGKDGDDTLDGGVGNDLLYGDGGNDTFIASYGFDEFWDTVGSDDVIVIPAAYSADDVSFMRSASAGLQNLIIMVEGLGQIKVGYQFQGYPIERVVFANGIDADITLSAVAYDVVGTEGNDSGLSGLTSLGAPDEHIYGYGGDDLLTGNNGNDVLDGGAGNDLLYGDDGDDTFVFSAGNDVIRDTTGSDVLLIPEAYDLSDVSFYRLASEYMYYVHVAVAGLGDVQIITQLPDNLIETISFANGVDSDILFSNVAYTVYGTGSGDALYGISSGSNPDEKFYGYAGNDFILAGSGDDWIDGGDGNDTIMGDSGTDTLSYLTASSGVNVSLVITSAQITGGSGTDTITSVENLTGSIYSDLLIGTSGDNIIDGDAGNDVIEGNAGNDILIGGAGIDRLTYVGSTASVTVNLATTSAQNTGWGGIDTISGFEDLTGTAYDDTLAGNSGANVIEGGAGNDILDGAGGTDTLTYTNATAGVTVNLATTTAQNTVGAGTDTITNFENLIGSAYNDILTGNASANVIEGGAGNDVLDGAGGTDRLTYANATAGVTVNLATTTAQNTVGAGTDTITNFENLTGSAYNDTLTGNGNANVIEGGDGNDTLNGAGGTDTLTYVNATAGVTVNLATTIAQNTAGAGTDTISNFENLTGSAYNDTLTGNANANVMEGGVGDDVLDGAGGTDTLTYTNAVAGVTVNLSTVIAQDTMGAGTDTISNFENITGSAFSDSLVGNSSANTLLGGDGDDILDGGDGNDVITGGNGNDRVTYATAAAGVTVNLTTTTSQNTVGAGSDTITSTENLTGSAFNDTLTGNTSANSIEGGAGNDTINGGDGNDTLNGGAGDDSITGGNGTDTVTYADASAAVTVNLATAAAQNTGGAGMDTLATIENLTGSAFNDVLTGNSSANTIAGGDGNDTIEGAGGNDILTGGNGTDTVTYASAGSAITFNLSTTTSQNTVGAGSDTVSGFENVTGSGFNDTLTGNSSANVIKGGAGNDTINGGDGNDLLYGEIGLDAMTGGLGSDTFVFEATSAYSAIDTISDFNAGQGDALNLANLLTEYDPLTEAITDFIWMQTSGSNTTVSVDRDGTGSTYGWTQIATLTGVTGLTDEAALVTNGNLLVA